MTEKPRLVELSALFKGENAKLLQGKTPKQIGVIQKVAVLRFRIRSGEIPLMGITLSTDEREIAETLKRELGVVHKAIPIMEMKLRVPKSALGVDGELKLGEVNNNEGIY